MNKQTNHGLQPLSPEQVVAEQQRIHNIMVAQLEARQQFAKEHPIAARKARQRAEAEARKGFVTNITFGSIHMKGRV